VYQGVEGAQRVTVYDVTFDNSYLSGGETFAASSVGLSSIDYGAFIGMKSAGSTTVNIANGHVEQTADPAANKFHLFDETPAEVASTADLSGVIARFKFYGH
jgi:hypothetical protein